MTIEEHGSGRQMARYRAWPRGSVIGWASAGVLVAASAVAGVERVWVACAVLGVGALVVGFRALMQCGGAMGAVRGALEETKRPFQN
jgi:hypothetical protein